jgi:hypothetical protein
LATALVAGKDRVPRPATGKTALVIFLLIHSLIKCVFWVFKDVQMKTACATDLYITTDSKLPIKKPKPDTGKQHYDCRLNGREILPKFYRHENANLNETNIPEIQNHFPVDKTKPVMVLSTPASLLRLPAPNGKDRDSGP